jgi:hypothetical protein
MLAKFSVPRKIDAVTPRKTGTFSGSGGVLNRSFPEERETLYFTGEFWAVSQEEPVPRQRQNIGDFKRPRSAAMQDRAF